MVKRLLLLLLLTAVAAGLRGNTLTYEADEMEYIAAENRFILRGNCVLGYDDAVMKADTVYYFVDDERLIAMGNIDFKQGGSRFTGKHMEYDMKLKRAILSNGRAPVEKGFISGKVINAVGEDVLYGKDTTFTTCDAIEPHFRVESKRLKVIKGDKVIASPVVIYIYHVPVFYFPAYFFPIPEGRKTGFLQPTFSNNTSDGLTYMQPFFLIINRYSDFTYTLKLMSERGISQEGELRFKTYNGGGTVEGAYIDDQIQNSTRWYLKGDATQTFEQMGIKMTLNADLSSDTDYYTDFSSNIDERTENTLSSYLSLEKRFGSKVNVRVTASKVRQWWDETDGTTSESNTSLLPSADISVYNLSLIPGFYLTATSGLDNLYEDDLFSKFTADNAVSLTYRHTLLRYFNFSESLKADWDYYVYDDMSIDRLVPSLNITSFFELYGYFNFFGIGDTDTVKHTLKPSVGFNYIPEVDQTLFLDKGEASLSQQENFSYGLNNTFMIKLKNGKTHVFLTTYSAVSQNLLDEQEFSQLSNSLIFTPYIRDTITSRFTAGQQYDLYEHETTAFYAANNSVFRLGDHRLDIYGYYRKDFSGGEDVFTSRIQASVQLTKNWLFKTSILLDLEESKIREQSFEFFRNLHCWNMGISWQERETGVIDYKFYIKLNAYGEFKWDYSGEVEKGGGAE